MALDRMAQLSREYPQRVAFLQTQQLVNPGTTVPWFFPPLAAQHVVAPHRDFATQPGSATQHNVVAQHDVAPLTDFAGQLGDAHQQPTLVNDPSEPITSAFRTLSVSSDPTTQTAEHPHP
jgi:hypothetical protein